jgi:thiamine-monophosphate kinase
VSPKKLSETELIKRLFLPLARNYEGALGLRDDAALIPELPGHEIVVTTDCLVEGVHFLQTDPPAAVAARVLRSNLSDLAAMGAAPEAYTMAISIPGHMGVPWLEQFTGQLATDQQAYDIHLAGGDTVATPGPLSIAITAFGRVPQGSALQRCGAQPDDGIYVTGTIGDAALGLRLLTGEMTLADKQAHDYLVERFYYPTARLPEGFAIRGQATACADISDGLLRDLGNICSASACGAVIHWEQIPLSPAASHALDLDASCMELILSGGDDYELVFTSAHPLNSNFTRIGTIKIGGQTDFSTEVRKNGDKVDIVWDAGYQHRW